MTQTASDHVPEHASEHPTNQSSGQSSDQDSFRASRCIELLARLVEFNTVSDRSNLQIIDFIESYLLEFGIKPVRLKDPAQDKVNLFATIGPDRPGGIVLSGHTDVVPTDGQAWSGDPFLMRNENGHAYGRGTCDMKGFLASVLASVPLFVKAELKVPIHLCFSYDEEVGCTGVGSLISHIVDQGLKPRACIVGEPTTMQIVTAHTGKQVFECRFKGTPMHSSLAPGGINAIVQAGLVIAKIDEIVSRLSRLRSSDSRFTYPYPTVNLGHIEGGRAINIVAEDCRFTVECRYPPGITADVFRRQLHSAISQVADQSGIQRSSPAYPEVVELVSYPEFSTPDSSEALKFVTDITGANQTFAVNYGTEAGHFSHAGIPTIVIGPGNIAQAHRADEFIELTQLMACGDFLKNIAAELSTREDAE